MESFEPLEQAVVVGTFAEWVVDAKMTTIYREVAIYMDETFVPLGKGRAELLLGGFPPLGMGDVASYGAGPCGCTSDSTPASGMSGSIPSSLVFGLFMHNYLWQRVHEFISGTNPDECVNRRRPEFIRLHSETGHSARISKHQKNRQRRPHR
jgi:hypothetical protein